MGFSNEFGSIGPADADDDGEDGYRTAVDQNEAAVETGFQELQDAYDAWKAYGTPEKRYERALATVEDTTYTAESIERFCERTPLQGRDGSFVSAAINAHDGSSYKLPDMAGVRHVGYRAKDEITVGGDAGDNVGVELRGTIHVEGRVGRDCGARMEEGLLRIDGAAREGVGTRMEGGRIIVQGNVPDPVGYRMRGGEILRQDGEELEQIAP